MCFQECFSVLFGSWLLPILSLFILCLHLPWSTSSKPNLIIIIFYYMSRHGRSEEITWRVTCQCPYVPVTSQWKWRLWEFKNVTKLLCMLRAIRLTEKHIYHIIAYSWHKVTHNMCLIMGFPRISHAETHQERVVSERSNFNQLG